MVKKKADRERTEKKGKVHERKGRDRKGKRERKEEGK